MIEALSPMPADMLAAWHRAGGRHGPVLRVSFEVPGADSRLFELQGDSRVTPASSAHGRWGPPHGPLGGRQRKRTP
jgi:hypothetical protein